MPDAQLRCTVYAGIDLPQPKRRAISRAILASSALGIIQPIITSSKSSGEKGCLDNNSLPTFTAKSDAENFPGFPFAFKNGVRAPSTIYTSRLMLFFISIFIFPVAYLLGNY